MEFRNLTPFDARAFPGVDTQDREYHVVALCVGYQLRPCHPRVPSDHPLSQHFDAQVIDDHPLALCLADEHWGDPRQHQPASRERPGALQATLRRHRDRQGLRRSAPHPAAHAAAPRARPNRADQQAPADDRPAPIGAPGRLRGVDARGPQPHPGLQPDPPDRRERGPLALRTGLWRCQCGGASPGWAARAARPCHERSLLPQPPGRGLDGARLL